MYGMWLCALPFPCKPVCFLPRDASAECGDATVSRLSVRLSVRDDQVS